MRSIHIFRRDHTTQIINCKPWSPRLHLYPSLIRKMQIYLELEGRDGNQPCTSTYQLGKTTSPQKTSVPKRAAGKKKRTKTSIKRQFMVRLVEKSLPVNTEPEVVATTTASTQTSVVKPTATAARLNPIPLTAYDLSKTKAQEIPNPTRRKFQEGEGPFTPNCGNPPMEQQQPKATATTTFAASPTRDDTPWPNTVPASTHLFLARSSWPISPNGNEVPTSTFFKTEKSDEKAPPKQAAILHTMVMGKLAKNNKSAEKCVDGNHNAPSVQNPTQT